MLINHVSQYATAVSNSPLYNSLDNTHCQANGESISKVYVVQYISSEPKYAHRQTDRQTDTSLHLMDVTRYRVTR